MALVDKLEGIFKEKLVKGLLPRYYVSFDHGNGIQAALFFDTEEKLFMELQRLSNAMLKGGITFTYTVGVLPVVLNLVLDL